MGDQLHDQLVQYYGICRETDALYSQLAERSGVSDSMLWVLYAVHMSGAQCTQRDISRIWAMSKQTVHSALKKLQEGGYITMEVSPSDRRSKHIYLTEYGLSFVRANIDGIFAAEQEAFCAMEEEERQALLRISGKYQHLLAERMTQLLREEKPAVQ